MKLSQREMTLAGLTGLVVLLGGSWWYGEPRLKEWRAAAADRQVLTERIETSQRMLTQRADWENQLQQFLDLLPHYPPGYDGTAEILKVLEQLARNSNLTLKRREPEPERQQGDLYEVAIHCTWEGTLEALVGFLHALQNQGVKLDVRQISVSPSPQAAQLLQGNFTVDCAYVRGVAPPAASALEEAPRDPVP